MLSYELFRIRHGLTVAFVVQVEVCLR